MGIKTSVVLGFFISLGLFLLGFEIKDSLLKVKGLERSVVAKGLSEKEVKADVVIWPISFTRANNNLEQLYSDLEKDVETIKSFLISKGIKDSEITLSTPSVDDKIAQQYGSNIPKYRYSARQTLTVYTKDVDLARECMKELVELGKKGITFRNDYYEDRIEYIFTKLNEIKPQMLKEATQKARISAKTFADDSNSKLGKIKRARQGQFIITNRDKNTPYIKKVRVVSTIEYYLDD